MLRRILPFIFLLILLGPACSPATSAVSPAETPQVVIENTPSVIASPTVTAVTAAAPKQGDLTFIEFFAIT